METKEKIMLSQEDDSEGSIMEEDFFELDEGEFRGDVFNGKLNGKGLIANKNKEVLYEGGFLDNNFDGFGVLYNPNK